MATSTRDLALADIYRLPALAAEAPDRDALFEAIAGIARQTCGFRLLTILAYIEADAVVERIYSSEPRTYPVGGRKPLARYMTNHAAMRAGEVFLAATAAEVAAAFADHALLASLGITAILNAPIRHAGRRLGTLNLSGEEGQYGPTQVLAARLLAGLLVPSLMALPPT